MSKVYDAYLDRTPAEQVAADRAALRERGFRDCAVCGTLTFFQHTVETAPGVFECFACILDDEATPEELAKDPPF